MELVLAFALGFGYANFIMFDFYTSEVIMCEEARSELATSEKICSTKLKELKDDKDN